MINILIILFIKIFSFFPLYILRFVAYIIYHINNLFFRYRYKIVERNLKIAFPSFSNKKHQEIKEKFYRRFFNVLMEIIKMYSISSRFINKKVIFENTEVINKYLDKNQSIILLSGHYNNWEWVGQKLALSTDKEVVVIYKKLNNLILNNFLLKIRSKFGANPISMKESIRYLLKTKNTCQIIGIIADQNPIVNDTTKWINFLNNETPVFLGPEKIAKKMNYPVLFCNMKINSDNIYSIKFEVISEEPSNDQKITEKYFNFLEKQIKENPQYWLWSHNRWKHKRKK